MALKQREIDRIYNALRPRINRPSGGVAYTPPTVTIPPHTHSADQITSNASTYVAADDVQEAIEELDSEKLARSGAQDWSGPDPLDMNTFDIFDVGKIDMENTLGEGVISYVRKLHLAGDQDDGEALIDGVEKVEFNDEVTKSVIANPSRIEMNASVTADSHYTAQEGTVSWDTEEATLVVWVLSGPGGVPV